MQIEEEKKCPTCGSLMNKSKDYYLCNICQSFFSNKEIEDMLQDKRTAYGIP